MTLFRRLGLFRVLELPGCVSGSYAGRLLAGLGAEVVVVEIEGMLDEPERRAYFHCGKKSVLFNNEELASQPLNKAIENADVILAPFGTVDSYVNMKESAVLIIEPESIGHRDEIIMEGTSMALRAFSGTSARIDTDARSRDSASSPVQSTPNDEIEQIWPQGLYRAADGWIMAGPGPHSRDTLLRLIASQGGDEFDLPDAALAKWIAKRERKEVFRTAQLWRLAFAPVFTYSEVSLDLHFVESGAFVESGDVPIPKSPFSWEGMPSLSAAPVPGADNGVLDDWNDLGADGEKSPDPSRGAVMS